MLRIKALKLLRARDERHMLSAPGVKGVGIGGSEIGNDMALVVFCDKLRKTLPTEFE